MSLPDERSMEPSSPIGRTQSGLAALFVTPSPRKRDGKADRAVDDEPYINKKKLSSTTTAKGDWNNGPSQKKRMEKPTELLMTNLTSTRGSRQAQRLQKVI
jgi:hypothetical protein